MRVLFLYTELAGYVLSCIKKLSKDAEVTVIHWPVNDEAPFDFGDIPGHFHEKDDQGHWKNKVEGAHYDVCFVSGWMDREYLKAARKRRGKTTTVLTLDNHWTGSLKQRLAQLLAPFTLHQTFNKAWVPGAPQKEYALKLGFKESNIKTGFYSAHLDYFNKVYTERIASDAFSKKRFLYMGRYVDFKGVNQLWSAFQRFHSTHPDWELWCAGTGQLWDSRVEHPGIKHLGFVQPNEQADILKECAVYFLPSLVEPWGVSVHEMAAAGFPMVLSSSVGSHEQFLIEGKNGLLLSEVREETLYEAMLFMASMTPEQLAEQGKVSHDLAQKVNPEQWVETVITFAKS